MGTPLPAAVGTPLPAVSGAPLPSPAEVLHYCLYVMHGTSPHDGSTGCPEPCASVPGRAYPRRVLSQSSFTAWELPKERRNSLSACCAPAGDAPWGRTEVLPTPLVGRCTGTHQKVTMQEPQGQRKTRELTVFPSSSSSAASPAEPFLRLSTWSTPRARQSSGLRVLPRLQRGAAGSDLEVAEPAGSPLVPACHGHRRGCIQQQGAGGLGLLLGCPCSGALVPGPWFGRKGSWALPVLLCLGDDHAVLEEEEVPLHPLAVALGHPHMHPQQRLGRCLVRRALLLGVRVIPAGQMASSMSKAAALGCSCASASPSHGGTRLDPQQQSHWPILTGPGEDP
ncbi:uncharacterized protein LOC133207741 [Neopsephotus bourkii]|uniref:uncharacterized protein LOC133207741 n=1 Tax=Neopsephotus bourkii TaxID=309878 RepID=UPI002AA566AF|nr:uncharacterized protein LOC133207741 [Neopsephotus bourkii]